MLAALALPHTPCNHYRFRQSTTTCPMSVLVIVAETTVSVETVMIGMMGTVWAMLANLLTMVLTVMVESVEMLRSMLFFLAQKSFIIEKSRIKAAEELHAAKELHYAQPTSHTLC